MRATGKRDELIVTAGEKRAVMSELSYNQLSRFIINILESKQTVTFFELLDLIEKNLHKVIKGDLHWHFLYVKQDLEARKIIRVNRDVNRNQLISLKRNYKERLEDLTLAKAVL